MTDPIVVVSWNAKVNRPDGEFGDGLQHLINDHRPQVIVLQEAQSYTDVLNNRFGDKWWVYAKSGWDESRMNPVLVWKKGYAKKNYDQRDGWDTLRYQTKWTGPQGGAHQGRTWTWVKVEGRIIMSFHRCTDGNGKNKEAFRDEYDKVTAFVDGRDDDEKVLILGDHNCGPKADFKGSSKRIAEAVGGSVRFEEADPGIDYAICLRQKGSVKHGKKYGSDHQCVVFKEKV